MSKNKKKHGVINFRDAQDAKAAKPFAQQRATTVSLIPKNTAQEDYVDLLCDRSNRISFAVGPAGTGKTYLAVLRAIQALKKHEVSKIIITRPAVSVDEQHGFLPGDLNQKMEPWTRPIMDVLEEYWSPEQIADMLSDRTIEICPLAYMRGRTFKNSFIILDEAQNTTPEQMKMFLTRLGKRSYAAVTGDGQQHDRGFEKNGLMDFVGRISDYTIHGIGVCEFTTKHVERDEIVESVLNIYGD